MNMGFVGLFLSGAVLFLNSMMLLGKADAKSVGVLNIFVGALQIFIPTYLIIVSNQTNWDLYQNAATFLFGLTYLYVGVISLKGLEGNGLGWFSLWVSIVAIFYALTSIIHFDDMVNALTWAMWAFLWFLFYLSNTLKKKIDSYIGIVACIQSWVTLTIPAMLYFLGVWNSPTTIQIMTFVLLLGFIAFAAALFRMQFSLKKDRKEVQMATE